MKLREREDALRRGENYSYNTRHRHLWIQSCATERENLGVYRAVRIVKTSSCVTPAREIITPASVT
jgi:hypothetical protein